MPRSLRMSGTSAAIAERMREEGILVSTDGPYKNVIKIKPPICFAKAEADLFLATLEEILGEDPLLIQDRNDAKFKIPLGMPTGIP